MVVDLSGFSFFIPIFAFLLVVIVVYSLLKKLDILGDNEWALFAVAIVIGIVFVTSVGVRSVVENVIPWFALLLIALFFIFISHGSRE